MRQANAAANIIRPLVVAICTVSFPAQTVWRQHYNSYSCVIS